MTLLVLFHTMDPRGGKLGGIETHVRLMLARFPGPVLLVGLDEIGDLVPGRPVEIAYEGRALRFLPVARTQPSRVNAAAKRLTQSVTLRFLVGALRHLPTIRRSVGGALASCEIERFEFAVLPRLLGRPCVLMVHNEERREAAMDSLLKRYWWLHRSNERVALELAARIFAVNPSIAERISGLSSRFARKTEVLSVSVDTSRFTPSAFVPSDTFRVCFAGRLDAFKDPPLMLASLAEAARRLEANPAGRFCRLAFDYVGASDIAAMPGFAVVEAIITRHGPRSASEVAAIMAAAHAGLITSFFEGMPCYLLEMLASGRPVAALELPQFRALLGDGGGRLVARGATRDASASAMAEALIDLARAIDAGGLDPHVLATLVEPQSVKAQMGRLFDAHAALAQSSVSASRP